MYPSNCPSSYTLRHRQTLTPHNTHEDSVVLTLRIVQENQAPNSGVVNVFTFAWRPFALCVSHM